MTTHDTTGDAQANAAFLRAILDTTVDGIITINAAGEIVTFNQAAEIIFGYGAAEAIGQNVAMLMSEPDTSVHDDYIEKYLNTNNANIIGIGRVVEGRRKDGTLFPIDLAVSEVTVRDSRYFTGVIRDITERRQMEQALSDERNLLSAILDTVGALVVVLDRKGRLIRFNRMCERTTGYTLADVQEKGFWELLIPVEERDAVHEIFSTLKQGQHTSSYENHWLTRDGKRRLISWSNTILADAQGTITHVIGTGIDITAQRRAEEAIVAVSEAERRLIGQELHDVLGQQLTGITLLSKALANSLNRERPELSEEVEGITELARDAVTEAKRLANGLYPTGIERVGLRDALGELAVTVQRVYRISCLFEGADDLPTCSESVQLHLYRIAQEATNNAVKHGRCTHIWIRLEREDHTLMLTVLDDGVGIPDMIPPGEGMGVEIMKYRARMLNARLDIARQADGGTMLTCVVPEGAEAVSIRTEL